MNLQIDSRKVKPGDIFFCLKGSAQDGHNYAMAAAENGASIIVHQDDIEYKKDGGTLYIKVADTLTALNEAANSFYGFPSEKLTMFGVTGTNGKSSIAYMISEIYSKYVAPCGYTGTIGGKLGYKSEQSAPGSTVDTGNANTTSADSAGAGDDITDDLTIEEIETRNNAYGVNLTTPGIIDMHRILADMIADGAKAASIEVSSHGLVQGRVDSVDFDYAIYTNLTPEHLDYFHDMDTYCDAKALFFKMLKPEAVAVINIDDEYGSRMMDGCTGKVITYGIEKDGSGSADYLAKNIKYSFEGMEFDICYKENGSDAVCHIKTDMHVTYNLYNLVAVAATLHQAGLSMKDIAAEFVHVPTIPGRMTNIDEGQNFKVIVDYAHTDDSYQQLLSYVRDDMPGVNRIITVFGMPGKRDKGNRVRLAKWVSTYGDYTILTEEDYRDETPQDIADDIASNFPADYKYEFIEDRYLAIEAAVKMAGANDVILILGKGAENYLDKTNGKVFWMGDDVAAHKALKTL